MVQPEGDALDLLLAEDRTLRNLTGQLDAIDGGSVDDRDRYGRIASGVIEHCAARQAAIMEILRVTHGSTSGAVAQLTRNDETRRRLLNRAEEMSRGVRGLDLNRGQDFDGALRELTSVVATDMADDETAVGRLRHDLGEAANELRPAGKVRHDSIIHRFGAGVPWYSHVPKLARLVAVYDHLRERIGQ